MPEAHYDGVATWYDEVAGSYAPSFAALVAARAAALAEPGDVVLDVGCGTGLYFDALRNIGLEPIGIDLSADQLRLARARAPVIRADAATLPVGDATLHVAVAAFVHTDVDDFAATVRELARVLVPGGHLVHAGIHPCFVGTFVDRTTERDDRRLVVRPGYGDARRVFGDNRSSGMSSRVGFRSLSLGALVRALLNAGMQIDAFDELDTRAQPWAPAPDDQTIVPWNVLLTASKGSIATD
jgi:SAM-dependent methyltransferase